MKTGLVLEGGAMRGLYTAGILDVWIDEGVRVDALFGTSAGAIFGANLFSGQKGRGLRYNLRYMPDKRYISVRSWLTTGDMFNRDFAYYRITNELDPFDEAAFERYGGEFYAVATNVETGEAECLRVDNMVEQLETLRATSALPFFSRMVEVDGKRYLDGGVSNSIPVRDCLERGYDRVVVILRRTTRSARTSPGWRRRERCSSSARRALWASGAWSAIPRGCRRSMTAARRMEGGRLRPSGRIWRNKPIENSLLLKQTAGCFVFWSRHHARPRR